jgi:hypothetical protein
VDALIEGWLERATVASTSRGDAASHGQIRCAPISEARLGFVKPGLNVKIRVDSFPVATSPAWYDWSAVKAITPRNVQT